MKFSTSAVTTATAIIAFFGAPVSSKKRRNSKKSLPLEPYSYFEPADFEGSYKRPASRLSSVIHHLPGSTAPITCVKVIQ